MAGRKKDRRSGTDRRVNAQPVSVERRQGGDRRSGERRRLEQTAGDQIYAAIDLLKRSTAEGALFEEDRALVNMAIHRLRAALRQLDEAGSGDGE